MHYSLKPIGRVRNGVREPTLSFRGKDLELNERELNGLQENSCSQLVLDESYIEHLDGLKDFSHILVLYWTHQVDKEDRGVTKVHPGGRKDYPLMGVFATRSPARPNPVCVTVVELLEVKENILKVKGLDAIDGSPIIDIKPYHPSFDSANDVRLPQWMRELTEYFSQGKG